MNKSELTKKIKELIIANKTKEALKLMSKAQLSDNDKAVILLLSKFTQLQQDSIIDKVSHVDLMREKAKINSAILDLAANIDAKEIAESNLDSEQINSPSVINNSKEVVSIPNALVTNEFPIEIQNQDKKKQGFKKYGKYFLPLLIIPFILLICKNRTDTAPDSKKTDKVEKKGNDKLVIDNFSNIPDDFLKDGEEIWSEKKSFVEDFSNIKPDNRTWRTSDKKDYWIGVENDDWFAFKLKTHNSRHKYLGMAKYDLSKEVLPFSVKVRIDAKLKCTSRNKCIGRGLTVLYNHSKKSAYAFTLNDSGDLRFAKFSSFYKYKSFDLGNKTLFSKQVQVSPNQTYELGIVCKGNKFFLFFEGEFIQMIEDREPLKGIYCGVFASGIGNHLFDEISLYNPIK